MANIASTTPKISTTPHPLFGQRAESSGNDNTPTAHFRIRPFTEVTKRKPRWLWNRYLERGVVNSITADPDTGKSTIVAEMAAALSTGRSLPGEDGSKEPIVVWILSSEDRADTVIKWRLENQGADLSRVLVTDEKVPLNVKGLQALERDIRERSIGLVVIDTITTWLDELDTNSANEAASFINGLKEIAQRTDCTFLIVRHNRKSGGSNKLHVGLGTIAITAAVRCELLASVFRGTRSLEKTKGNVGRKPPKLLYEIVDGPDPENPHGILRWAGSVPVTDSQGAVSRTPLKLDACKEWLVERLSGGPANVSELMGEGAKKGFSEATMKRAKKDLRISPEQVGPQHWVWALPKEVARQDESVTQVP